MRTKPKTGSVSAITLIKQLPYQEFSEIATRTKVDYKAKKLHGIDLISDLILSMLYSSQVSQRIISMENGLPLLSDIRDDSGINRKIVCHSSISERLDKVSIEFFKDSYEFLCRKYQRFVPDSVLEEMSITRVDSTMVAETANKLKEGFTTGVNDGVGKERRQLKYTMAYNGLNVTCARIFTAQTYSSDNAPISKVVLDNLRKMDGMSTCYVFDRALCNIDDLKKISEMTAENQAFFVGRLNLARRTDPIESLLGKDTRLKDDEIEIISDERCYLRAKGSMKWDMSESYRIIRVRFINSRPDAPRNTRRHARHYDEEMVLITNNFEKEAIEITEYYRRRWDIEVFFKFLKQDLSFSHFISTSVNGITVMLYMTLIVALLIKIYSVTHNLGPRITKMAIINEINMYLAQRITQLEKETREQAARIKCLQNRMLNTIKSSDH